MGLLTLWISLRSGITQAWVSEPHPDRAAAAEALGGSVVGVSGDAAGDVLHSTGGQGVDVAYEAVGAERTVLQAIQATRIGGTVVILGVASPEARVSISPRELFARELTIRGAWGQETTFDRAIDILAKEPTPVESTVFQLNQFDQAVTAARNRSVAKVMFNVGNLL